MAIYGVGIDVVDFQRFAEVINRTSGFNDRVFTTNERNKNLPSRAARFAAKEALTKALNANQPFNWQEVEILNEDSGKPYFNFSGELALRMKPFQVHLSLSHDAGIASAMVIVEQL
jgi:holo-[acyl-carrier protein] synthase